MHEFVPPVVAVPHTSLPQQSVSVAQPPPREAHVVHVPKSELEHCVPGQHSPDVNAPHDEPTPRQAEHTPPRHPSPEQQVAPEHDVPLDPHGGGHGTPPHRHSPPTQLPFDGHALKHVPQLFGSLDLSTQLPPHESAAGHTHAPALQLVRGPRDA